MNLTQTTSFEETDRKTTVLHQNQIDEFATIKTRLQHMNNGMKKKKKLMNAVQHQE